MSPEAEAGAAAEAGAEASCLSQLELAGGHGRRAPRHAHSRSGALRQTRSCRYATPQRSLQRRDDPHVRRDERKVRGGWRGELVCVRGSASDRKPKLTPVRILGGRSAERLLRMEDVDLVQSVTVRPQLITYARITYVRRGISIGHTLFSAKSLNKLNEHINLTA